MLMSTNNRAIHKINFAVNLRQRIALLLQGLQDPILDTRLAPAIKATEHGAYFAIALRQVAPGGARADDPEHAVDHSESITSLLEGNT